MSHPFPAQVACQPCATESGKEEQVAVVGGGGPYLHEGKMIDGRAARGTQKKKLEAKRKARAASLSSASDAGRDPDCRDSDRESNAPTPWTYDDATESWTPSPEDAKDFATVGPRVGESVRAEVDDDVEDGVVIGVGSVLDGKKRRTCFRVAYSSGCQGDLWQEELEHAIKAYEAREAATLTDWAWDDFKDAWVPCDQDKDFDVDAADCGTRVKWFDGDEDRLGVIIGVGVIDDENGEPSDAFRVCYANGDQGDLWREEFEEYRDAYVQHVRRNARVTLDLYQGDGAMAQVVAFFEGATFADPEAASARIGTFKSATDAGVVVAWAGGRQVSHLTWDQAADAVVGTADPPAPTQKRKAKARARKAPSPPAAKKQKPLPPMAPLETALCVSAPPPPAILFPEGATVDAKFGRRWYAGVVDEVIHKGDADAKKAKAYEILWANGDCNRIAASNVRCHIPGTEAG